MINHIQVFFFLDLLIIGRCISLSQKILKRKIASWSLFMNPIRMFGQLILKQKPGNMKCVICKTGTMLNGEVTVTLEKNGSIILIKEVPAFVCDVCEHYYLDETITGEVLKRGKDALSKGAELEVLKLKGA